MEMLQEVNQRKRGKLQILAGNMEGILKEDGQKGNYQSPCNSNKLPQREIKHQMLLMEEE
jgi:hypothetical protein